MASAPSMNGSISRTGRSGRPAPSTLATAPAASSSAVEVDPRIQHASASPSRFSAVGRPHQRCRACSTLSGFMCATKSRDIVVGGRRHDVLGRAGLDDPAALHDRDAVADLQRLVEVVADEDDRLAAAAAAARAARPAACRGSADRAPRTARPSAGCRRRWRRRARGRRAAACRRRARARTCPAHCVEVDHARASRRRSRSRSAFGMPRSSRPKPTFSAHRAPRQQRELLEHHGDAAACAARAASPASQRGDVDRLARRRSTRTSPRATLLRPLTARSSVDLPEPDRPISTQISPALDGEADAGDAEHLRRSRPGSRRGSCPGRSAAAPSAASSPKTMSTLSKSTAGIGSAPRPAALGLLADAVEHDREDTMARPGLEAHARC